MQRDWLAPTGMGPRAKSAMCGGTRASADAVETSIVNWMDRVRGEYREMPGLALTERQAQRLWGLDSDACRALFEALLQTGFLRRTTQGGYIRADVG